MTVARGAPSPRAERWGVSALFFLNGFGFANWAARIPQVQQSLGIGEAALGVALLALAAGSLVSMPLVGAATSRYGTARPARFCALAFCVTLAGPSLAPGYGAFLVALVAFGACHGAMDVSMNAQAAANEHRLGRPVMSSFHGVYSVGGLAGAAAGGLWGEFLVPPGTHMALTAGAIGAGVLAAVTRLPEDTRGQDTGGFAFARPTRGLALLALIAFCLLLGEGAMADWSAVYLAKVLGADAASAAAGFAAFSATMAAGRFAGDRIVRRFGRGSVVRWGGALALAGMALAAAAPGVPLAVAGFALVGAGFACIFPCLMSAAARSATGAPGTAIAAVATAGYTGFLLGPPLIGFVAHSSSLRWGLGLVALLCAVVVLLAPRVGR